MVAVESVETEVADAAAAAAISSLLSFLNDNLRFKNVDVGTILLLITIYLLIDHIERHLWKLKKVVLTTIGDQHLQEATSRQPKLKSGIKKSAVLDQKQK